jgi:hypothetical protein
MTNRGATSGDVLIFLATLSVAAALLYPAWSVRDFRSRVDSAIADVETLAGAARGMRDRDARWPTPAPPGEAPAELPALLAEGGPFNGVGYTLGWTTWDVVDSVAAPPLAVPAAPGDAPPDSVGPRMEPVVRRVGAVTVHSSEVALLAELTERFAEETTFVLDTMWLLVLPERASAPAARP